MIDLLHLPTDDERVRVYLPTGTDANAWQTWNKPRGNYTMVSIYAIGPGGGGGGGRGNTAGAGKGGGGGGGSGGISRVTVPLALLPDVLYIRTTPGGSGGAGGSSADGTVGNNAFAPATTLVASYPSTTTQYLLTLANLGAGGVGGTTTTANGGGAAGIASTADCPLALWGTSLFIAGIAGTNAGSGAGNNNGSAFTQTTGSQILPGTGGGGSSNGSSAGGNVTALANTRFTIGPGQSAAVGGDGMRWGQYPKWYGGIGGGANNATTGADGGNGSVPGCGGGGGGGGVTVGGRGGDGGPGCVVIHVW